MIKCATCGAAVGVLPCSMANCPEKKSLPQPESSESINDFLARLDYDPPGDDPMSDVVGDVWLDAQMAFESAAPKHQHGHTEWCDRMKAAICVLIDQLPANAKSKSNE